MQRRLQEYERRGVQATLDMQQAARGVALENDHLRALLASHGISSNEIDRFLHFGVATRDSQRCRGAEDGSSNPSHALQQAPPDGVPCLTEGWRPSSQPLDTPRTSVPPRSCSQGPSSTDFSISVNSVAATMNGRSVPSMPQEEPNVNDNDHEIPLVYHADDVDDEPPRVAEGHTSPRPVSIPNAGSVASYSASSMETLCDAAATIIADLHGHGDKMLAFTALGCPGTKDCVVQNIKIFDLIDKTT